MPHTITDEAIVLKTYDVGEADKFCVLLLREHGKIAARAMGVRKLLSRKRGLLPCHRIAVTLRQGSIPGSSYFVETVRCLDSASHVWMEAPSFASASSALELVFRMMEEHSPVPSVYDLCREFLEEAGRTPPDQLTSLFTLKLLGLLGSLPSLTHSCVGGRELRDDARLGGAERRSRASFSERLGGLCFPDEDAAGYLLSPECCVLLPTLQASPLSSLAPLSDPALRDLDLIAQGLLGSQLGISLSSGPVGRSISSGVTPTCQVNARVS